MAIVTCHTEDCENAEQPIDLELSTPDLDTGEPVFVSAVLCGVCGHEITDVVPPLPEVAA